MRNITDVIKQLQNVSSNDDFKNLLNYILNDYRYKAPEVASELWWDLQSALISCYETPYSSGEALELFSIFTTKTKDELLSMKDN